MGEPGCDMVGSELVLPDGNMLKIGGIGDVRTVDAVGPNTESGSNKILIVNWGAAGVAVTQTSSDEQPFRWASTEQALELQLQQEKS